MTPPLPDHLNRPDQHIAAGADYPAAYPPYAGRIPCKVATRSAINKTIYTGGLRSSRIMAVAGRHMRGHEHSAPGTKLFSVFLQGARRTTPLANGDGVRAARAKR